MDISLKSLFFFFFFAPFFSFIIHALHKTFLWWWCLRAAGKTVKVSAQPIILQVWLALGYLVAVCNNSLRVGRHGHSDPCSRGGRTKRTILLLLVAKSTLASVVDLPLLKGGDFEDGPDSEHQCCAFRRVTMAITQFLWSRFQILFGKDQLGEHVLCPPHLGKGIFGSLHVCERPAEHA